MILNGKQLAKDIIEDISQKLRQKPLQMGLAVLLVGDDTASHKYVGIKKRTCEKLGIHFECHQFKEDVHQLSIEKKITELNTNDNITGILIQLPLPKHLNTQKIISTITPLKDVDGFHPENIENYIDGNTTFLGGLPKGIWKLLEATKENFKKKKILIISKSPQFGDILIALFKQKQFKSEWIAPSDSSFNKKLEKADIVISAIGEAHKINASMIKEGSILIDIGINRLQGKTVGDIDFESCKEKAKAITPVPGGVGPMTVAMLIENLMELALLQKKSL